MKVTYSVGTLLGVAVLLTGCSGGSGSTNGASLTTRAAVLLTDSPREDYAHIWATIYHVELTSASGTPVVLFDDANGKQIDLKTLRDASGQRFSFLSGATIPSGTYTGIAVTLGAALQLFQNGATVATSLPVNSTVPKNSAGLPVVTVAFKSPKTLASGSTNLVLDFDLAHFIVKNSTVLPAIVEGSETEITDTARHNDGDYHGTVSSLTGTAPVLTFTLTDRDNTTVTIVTSAATAIYGNGTLANGSKIEVDGTLDTTTQSITATQIEVCGTGGDGKISPDNHAPRVDGSAANLNGTAGTFTITIDRAHGFTPAQTTVNIVTTSATQYFADGGSTQAAAQVFTALATVPTVSVVGTYDVTTNTLTATVVKAINHAEDGNKSGSNTANYRPGMDRQNWGHDHL